MIAGRCKTRLKSSTVKVMPMLSMSRPRRPVKYSVEMPVNTPGAIKPMPATAAVHSGKRLEKTLENFLKCVMKPAGGTAAASCIMSCGSRAAL